MTEERSATLDRAIDRPPPPGHRSRWHRPGVVLPVAVVLAAAAGAGAVVLRSSRTEPYQPHPASVQALRLPGAAPVGPAAAPALPRAPAAAGRTPAAAVTAFLAARRAGRDAASYALLAPAARRDLRGVAEWRNAQATRPRPTGFRVAAVNGAEVRVAVTQHGVLDQLAGFVPGQVRAAYRTVRTTAGWRVLPDPVTATPVLPPDPAAAAAATRWLALRSACDPAGAAGLQASGDLLGDVGYAAAPCRTGGSWRAGAATPLVEGPRAQPFLAAYGSGVGSWARVVPVAGPRGARFLVALAPLGAQWRVFGLVRDGTGGSGAAVG